MSGRLALVVDGKGAVLETGTHGTVVLTYADGTRERVGIRALGSVVLHGEVKLSTGVLQALAAEGVPVTFLSSGRQASAIEFSPLPERQVTLRHAQHLAYADPARRHDMARRVVLAKLEAMAEICRQLTPTCEGRLYRAMRSACEANDLSALMGVEGAATACYFEGLAALYAGIGPFCFNGRSRQPPRDEPNALMSLAYTMAQAPIRQLAVGAGLDLQVGFLHAMSHRRQALLLDLIEPVRAELDQWVYGLLIQRRVLSPGMFSRNPDTGVRLTKEGREAFYTLWFREGSRIALQPARKLLAAMLTTLRTLPLSQRPHLTH